MANESVEVGGRLKIKISTTIKMNVQSSRETRQISMSMAALANEDESLEVVGLPTELASDFGSQFMAITGKLVVT